MSLNIEFKSTSPSLSPIPAPEASEPSSSAAAVNLLAQRTFDALPEVHPPVAPDSLANMRAYQSRPEPPLGMRSGNIDPQSTFGLDPMEHIILQEMLTNWGPESQIDLLGLFGVEITSKTRGMANSLSQEQFNSLLTRLGSIFFSIYIRYRVEKQNITVQSEVVQGNLMPTSTYLDELDLWRKDLSIALERTQLDPRQNNVKAPNHIQMKGHIQRQAHYQEARKTLKRVDVTINVLKKILQNEAVHFYLIDKGINLLKCTKKSKQVDTKCFNKILDKLCDYANFCMIMTVHLPEKSPFAKLKSFCNEIKEKPITQKNLNKIKHLMNEQRADLVKQGSFAHTLINRYMKKTYDTDIEVLLSFEATKSMILTAIHQLQCIFDYEIVMKHFPDFIPSDMVLQRVMANIRCCPRTLPQHELIPLAQNLTDKFQNYFRALIHPIEMACEPALPFVKHLHGSQNSGTSLLDFTAKYHFRYSDLTLYRYMFCNHTSNFDQILSNIHAAADGISMKLEQFLNEQVQALPEDVSTQDREKMADAIRVMYWEKTRFLNQIVTIIEDILTLEKGMISTDLTNNLWQSADEMMINRLYTILGISSEEELDGEDNVSEDDLDGPLEPFFEDVPEEAFEVGPSFTPLSATPSSAAAAASESFHEETLDEPIDPLAATPYNEASASPAHFIEISEDEEKGARRSPSPVQVRAQSASASALRPKPVKPTHQEKTTTGPQTFPRASPEICNMTSFRDIIKELKKAGFRRIRQKGSHAIFRDPFGRIVPVSMHGEVSPGLACQMYAEAIAPIRYLRVKPQGPALLPKKAQSAQQPSSQKAKPGGKSHKKKR